MLFAVFRYAQFARSIGGSKPKEPVFTAFRLYLLLVVLYCIAGFPIDDKGFTFSLMLIVTLVAVVQQSENAQVVRSVISQRHAVPVSGIRAGTV